MPTDRTRVCLLRHEDGSYRLLATCACLAVVLLDAHGSVGSCEHCGAEIEPRSGHAPFPRRTEIA
jgi:hypothetical protein